MFEVLNDPWGFFCVAMLIGMFGSIIICGIVLSVQCHLNYLRKPKHGATKMCDRELRRRLRHRS